MLGRYRLTALRTLAAGCPLLADITINLTVEGLYYVASHFTNLKKCKSCFKVLDDAVYNDLVTRYPAIEWNLLVNADDSDGSSVSDEEGGSDDDDGDYDSGDDNGAIVQ